MDKKNLKTAPCGTNVEVAIDGNTLVILVDLTQTHGDSKSGKSIIVGSTHGTLRLAAVGKPEFMLGVNVNKKG